MKHLLIAYGVYYLYCKKIEQDQTVRTFPKQSKVLGDAQSGQHKKRVYHGGVQSLR